MAAISAPNLKKTVPTGFQAQLRGASLWDLVQMECLNRTRRIVRVTTLENVGYLYFDTGNIVHAATPQLSGEAAAFEMFEWSQGTFEPCERDWPVRPSITISVQALMMKAAHARDERARHKLVAFPSKERAVEQAEAAVTVESQITMKAPNGNPNWNGIDFALAVRLGSDGTVIASKGPADEFANIAAYACRLVEIIGELMGMEGFAGLECTFKEGRCFIVKEADGSVLAVKPTPQADLTLIKERIGF
jgi:hypothetical protein